MLGFPKFVLWNGKMSGRLNGKASAYKPAIFYVDWTEKPLFTAFRIDS
jgi:hypothetical protein